MLGRQVPPFGRLCHGCFQAGEFKVAAGVVFRNLTNEHPPITAVHVYSHLSTPYISKINWYGSEVLLHLNDTFALLVVGARWLYVQKCSYELTQRFLVI